MVSAQSLAHRDAIHIRDAIRTELESNHKSAAITGVDAHGVLPAFVRTDGCRLPSIGIAINKAYTRVARRSKAGSWGNAREKRASR